MADEVAAFFDGYSDDVCALAKALREHVKDAAPNATETLHTGWKVVSYGHKKKFCAIAPHAQWVNLQFHNGAVLDDPTHLLEGTGKAMRHHKVHTAAELGPQLTSLIREAVNRA